MTPPITRLFQADRRGRVARVAKNRQSVAEKKFANHPLNISRLTGLSDLALIGSGIGFASGRALLSILPGSMIGAIGGRRVRRTCGGSFSVHMGSSNRRAGWSSAPAPRAHRRRAAYQ